MKGRQTPKWEMVIRDLRRGLVYITTPEGDFRVSLQGQHIPEEHLPETAPNNPLERDVIKAWAVDQVRWLTFKLSELKYYGIEERRKVAEDSGRAGDNPTEETSQET
jgi:hypothetical protein